MPRLWLSGAGLCPHGACSSMPKLREAARLIDIGTHALRPYSVADGQLRASKWLWAAYTASLPTTRTAQMPGAPGIRRNIPWKIPHSALYALKTAATVVLKSSWALNILDFKEANCILCGDKAGADMLDGLRINGEKFSQTYVSKAGSKSRRRGLL